MTRAHAAFASAHDVNDAGNVTTGCFATDAEGAAGVGAASAVGTLGVGDEAGTGCAGGAAATGDGVAAAERGAPGAQPTTSIAMTCGSVIDAEVGRANIAW